MIKQYLLILSIGILSTNVSAQLIHKAPSLPGTNTVEIGYDKACELSENPTSSVEKYLLFDSTSGQIKGVLHETHIGRTFFFDSEGLLRFIAQEGAGSTLNVFDTHGKWVYIVKSGKHVFDTQGERRGVLTVFEGRVILTKIKSPAPHSPQLKKRSITELR